MTPYHLLAEAAKTMPSRSFLDAWNDFACWEKARGYRDDPNAASKEDLEWIQTLNSLAYQLEERLGDSTDCRNALEAAAAAFASLEHENEMYQALITWRQQRTKERLEEQRQDHTPQATN
jgi:hypothetical protein